MRIAWVKAGLCLIFVCISFSAHADSFVETWLDQFGSEVSDYAGSTAFPLLDIPFGGRFEAMGGAYSAIGGDLGSLESNPAGTAVSPGPGLSFFHHEWIADSAIETVAFVDSIGPIGFGVGAKYFHVPFTAYDDAGERMSSGTFTEIVGVANASLRFLHSEKFSLAAGANVKAAFRHVPEQIAAGQSALVIPFDFGFLSSIRLLDFSGTGRENFALGLSLRNIGPAVMPFEAPLPTSLSGGLAYRPFRFLLLAGDISIAIDPVDFVFHWEDLSYAVGASVQFVSFLSIHSGARIELSRPALSLGSTVRLGNISLDATYSMDLALGLNPLNSLSVGATLDLTPDVDRMSGT